MLTSIPLLGITILSAGQPTKRWTGSEKEYHNTLENLCKYLVSHKDSLDMRNPDIQQYILFDYVLTDTSIERKKRRIPYINDLLAKFAHFVDSMGVSNLDAAPVRFYKNDSNYYRPFNKNIAELAPLSFAYFSKSKKGKPLGYLLFDDKSNKLISWILINQGGYYYFLIFNLV
jgi:hypothetical protein